MENLGVQAGYQVAFSHTGKWRARGEEETSCPHRQDKGFQERRQTAAVEVTKMPKWMERDPTDTDTSLMD
jgi:hypothetical protein